MITKDELEELEKKYEGVTLKKEPQTIGFYIVLIKIDLGGVKHIMSFIQGVGHIELNIDYVEDVVRSSLAMVRKEFREKNL